MVIVGDNPGGNLTCAEVETYFELDEGTLFCTGKVDYDGDEFEGSFPEGLTVNVLMGRYVEFELEGGKCIDIEGTMYKVGAVIVKGGPKANVYYYPEGTLYDCGLSAPVNPSGKPAGLSNLTFCMVSCDYEPNLVIAIKSILLDGASPAVSDGTLAFAGNSYWCGNGEYGWALGYNPFTLESSFNMVTAGTDTKVGLVNIDADGVVTITMDEGLTLDISYVFVGTLYDLRNTNLSTVQVGCPIYTNWATNDVDGQTQTFFDD